jgi:hypothetical protein
MQITVRMTPEMKSLITKLRGDIGGAMSAGMENLLAALEARAVKETPVDSSNLVNSITHYVTDGGRTGILKATAPYAEHVHEGTGLFGPHKKRIVPRDKKALFWPGARHPVKSVKGMKGRPFFTRAIEKTDAQAEYEEGLRNFLKRRRW